MNYRKNLYSRIKASVRVASIGDVSIASAPASIDDITLAVNDRVLLKNQPAGEENGLYRFEGEGFPLVRSRDADNNDELSAGALMYVEEGTQNAGKTFILTTSGDIDLGVTAITFAEAYAVTPGGGGGGNFDGSYIGYNAETDLLYVQYFAEMPSTLDSMEIVYLNSGGMPAVVTLLHSLGEFFYDGVSVPSVSDITSIIGQSSTITSIRLQNAAGYDRTFASGNPGEGLPLLIEAVDIQASFSDIDDQVAVIGRFTDITSADELVFTDDQSNVTTLTSSDWVVSGNSLLINEAWNKLASGTLNAGKDFTLVEVLQSGNPLGTVYLSGGQLHIQSPANAYGMTANDQVIVWVYDVLGAYDEIQFVDAAMATVTLTEADWTVDAQTGFVYLTVDSAWSKMGGNDPSGERVFNSFTILNGGNPVFSKETNGIPVGQPTP